MPILFLLLLGAAAVAAAGAKKSGPSYTKAGAPSAADLQKLAKSSGLRQLLKADPKAPYRVEDAVAVAQELLRRGRESLEIGFKKEAFRTNSGVRFLASVLIDYEERLKYWSRTESYRVRVDANGKPFVTSWDWIIEYDAWKLGQLATLDKKKKPARPPTARYALVNSAAQDGYNETERVRGIMWEVIAPMLYGATPSVPEYTPNPYAPKNIGFEAKGQELQAAWDALVNLRDPNGNYLGKLGLFTDALTNKGRDIGLPMGLLAGGTTPVLWFYMNQAEKGGTKGQKEKLQSVVYYLGNYFLDPRTASVPSARDNGKWVPGRIPVVNPVTRSFKDGPDSVRNWVPIFDPKATRLALTNLADLLRNPVETWCAYSIKAKVQMSPDPCATNQSLKVAIESLRVDDEAKDEVGVNETNLERIKLCALMPEISYRYVSVKPRPDWTDFLLTVAGTVVQSVAKVAPIPGVDVAAGYVAKAIDVGRAGKAIYDAATDKKNYQQVVDGIQDGLIAIFDKSTLITKDDIVNAKKFADALDQKDAFAFQSSIGELADSVQSKDLAAEAKKIQAGAEEAASKGKKAVSSFLS